jgi:Flp pilus assembly protein TadD
MQARERYEDILARDPGVVDAWIGLTQVAEAEGRLADAVVELERLRNGGQLSFDQQVRLGTLYLREGQAAKALDLAAALPSGLGTRPEARELTGRAQLALGRPEDARTAFRSMYGAIQGSPEALYRLSHLQAAAGDREGARWSIERALEFQPDLTLADKDLPTSALLTVTFRTSPGGLPTGVTPWVSVSLVKGRRSLGPSGPPPPLP